MLRRNRLTPRPSGRLRRRLTQALGVTGEISVFWKKKPDLAKVRAEQTKMAAGLLSAARLQFPQLSRLHQALVGTFLFGMLHADGAIRGLEPAQIHALALIVFAETFDYSSELNAQAVQECINATSPGYHDTMNAVIHRGIDGHRQYCQGQLSTLGENLRSILAHFEGGA